VERHRRSEWRIGLFLRPDVGEDRFCPLPASEIPGDCLLRSTTAEEFAVYYETAARATGAS